MPAWWLLTGFSAEPSPLFRLRLLCRRRFLDGLFFFRGRFFLFGRLFCFWLRAFWFCSFRLWFGFFSFAFFFFSGSCLPVFAISNHPLKAIALGRSRRDVLKQFLNGILLAQSRQCGPTRVNRSVFPESNHSLCQRANGLRLGQRGLDTLMFDQRTNLIRQERLAVLSFATQFDRLFLMPHSRSHPDF